MKNLLAALAIVSMTLLTSCSKQEQSQTTDTSQVASVKSGQGLGIVRAIDTTGKTITLAHNNIPNIMDAMTMDYPVPNASTLSGLSVGDSVRFTLEDRGDGNYLVTNITPIKKGLTP